MLVQQLTREMESSIRLLVSPARCELSVPVLFVPRIAANLQTSTLR